MPASTQKVLTAVAALDAFGPSHRFVTELRASRPIGATVRWATCSCAAAIPALTSEQWWRLAADLRALGLREVRGDLVLDDGLFDEERWHPSWAPVTARAYHAPVSALVRELRRVPRARGAGRGAGRAAPGRRSIRPWRICAA